jgi:hypothetical protein
LAYTPKWEPLADALKRVMATGVAEEEAKIDLCRAVADRAIDIQVRIAASDHGMGGRVFSGGSVGVPPHLAPPDFDWKRSLPLKPWAIGPKLVEHYFWSGGEKICQIDLIELSTVDVQKFLRDTEAITTPRPDGTTGAKASSNQPPRKRRKPMQYHINRAVTDIKSRYGESWPPDDMPASVRDQEIIKWLDQDDDPVKPSERTLRDYFCKQRR